MESKYKVIEYSPNGSVIVDEELTYDDAVSTANLYNEESSPFCICVVREMVQ